jgi:VWFA-related protein
MRRHAWVALAQLWALSLPVCAASRVTVQQLAELLASARASHSPDDETARRIGRVALKERLSGETLSTLERGLGEGARQALELAADQSSFLDLPAAEIAPGPAPTPAEQQAMLQAALSYVFHYVDVLPNLICRETVYRFDDASTAGRHYRAGELHLRDTIAGELTVRDRAESFKLQRTSAAAPGGEQPLTNQSSDPKTGMTTSGEFGHALGALFAAGTQSFVWRRWEMVDGKRVAVFDYLVPSSDSRFVCSWSGERGHEGRRDFSRKSAYHGEVAIDPAFGGVFRLTEQALSLPQGFPVQRSDTAVEYRAVNLGGKFLLCPARSITIMDGHPSIAPVHEQLMATAEINIVNLSALGHYLNRVEFTSYRKFEAQTKLSFETSAALPSAPPAQARAKQPVPAASQPVVPVRPAEIPVPVVVTDEYGNAVGNLRSDDFELLDNGKSQQISGFEIQGRVAALPAQEVPVHYVLYLFDNLNLASGELSGTRTAAERALQDPAESRTRIAVLATSETKSLELAGGLTQAGEGHVQNLFDELSPVSGDGSQSPLDFTGDLAKVERAMNRISPQPPSGGPSLPCPKVSHHVADLLVNHNDPNALSLVVSDASACGRIPPGASSETAAAIAKAAASEALRLYAAQSQRALSELKTAVQRLAAMPGDRAIVFVSPGFPAPETLSDLNDVIDLAAHSGIPINTLDARGAFPPPAPDGNNAYDLLDRAANAELLAELARSSGGVCIRNDDFYAGFKRLAWSPEVRYLLTFSPSDWDTDGSFHELQVTIRNRAGLSVRARNGYLAPTQPPAPAEQAK